MNISTIDAKGGYICRKKLRRIIILATYSKIIEIDEVDPHLYKYCLFPFL